MKDQQYRNGHLTMLIAGASIMLIGVIFGYAFGIAKGDVAGEEDEE